MDIDKANGNNLWRDAVAKEIEAEQVAFKILDDSKETPPGYHFIKCHMIFDIKLDGFCRNVRMVAGGHMTEAPAVMTYASVVSRETVQVALTIATLNGLEVKATTLRCKEKIWTHLGPKFGSNCGKKALILRVLYGLKSAGASFGYHLADCMHHLGYIICQADADLWLKPMVHPDDGSEYYA